LDDFHALSCSVIGFVLAQGGGKRRTHAPLPDERVVWLGAPSRRPLGGLERRTD
jgi:hypothetical protein